MNMAEKNLLITIRVAMIICAVSMALVVYLLIESWIDRGICADEFERVSGLKAFDSFANDDAFILNFGMNLDCTVYWFEGELFSSVEFKNGELTQSDIEREGRGA